MRKKRLSTSPIHKLQDQATKLIAKTFRFLPCVVCLSFNKHNYETVPHHLLNEGLYGSKRWTMWNLLPLCSEHHTMGTEIVTEAAGRDTGVIKNFMAWLKNTLPEHYNWYVSNKDDRAPHKLTLGDMGEICSGLQYCADHPGEAEILIYEK